VGGIKAAGGADRAREFHEFASNAKFFSRRAIRSMRIMAFSKRAGDCGNDSAFPLAVLDSGRHPERWGDADFQLDMPHFQWLEGADP
jgi:hypothetical protein